MESKSAHSVHAEDQHAVHQPTDQGLNPRRVVGVDIGGTFIDYVSVDDSGSVQTHKELSDPSDLAGAFLRGLLVVAPAGVRRLVHGTTVATNALLERTGARTGLVTTAGFADVLVIGRQNRPRLYALDGSRPDPIVPAELRLGVTERVDAAGTVLTALDHASVTNVARILAAAGVQSVAVSLLFSFLHPEHERRVQELLKQALPDVFICLSSDVLPEFREYERTSTTVAAAYIGPLLEHYLAKLEPAVQGEFQVMQSNGGVMGGEAAKAKPVYMVESGPAAGVIAAGALAQAMGYENVISFDMGGTTAKVGLVLGGEIRAWRDVPEAELRAETWIDGERVGSGGATTLPGGLIAAYAFALSRSARRGLAIGAGVQFDDGRAERHGAHEVPQVDGPRPRAARGDGGADRRRVVRPVDRDAVAAAPAGRQVGLARRQREDAAPVVGAEARAGGLVGDREAPDGRRRGRLPP